jgi:hypothetical protein
MWGCDLGHGFSYFFILFLFLLVSHLSRVVVNDRVNDPHNTSALMTPMHSDPELGGCCSSAAYEAALAMLEVEGDVTGQTAYCASCLPTTMAVTGISMNTSSTMGVFDQEQQVSQPSAEEGCFIPALSVIDAITRRMVHAFPWTPASGVHWVLAGRRCGLQAGQVSASRVSRAGTSFVVAVLPARGQPTRPDQPLVGGSTLSSAGNSVAARRRLMIRVRRQ